MSPTLVEQRAAICRFETPRARMAPVSAPASWPNISLSGRSAAAAQLRRDERQGGAAATLVQQLHRDILYLAKTDQLQRADESASFRSRRGSTNMARLLPANSGQLRRDTVDFDA
jgi:hypothetical protein